MNHVSFVFVFLGLVFFVLSFGRVEPIVLSESSLSECVLIPTPRTHWALIHSDRSVSAFRVLVDGEVWFHHKGGRPIGTAMSEGRVLLTDSLKPRYNQCFELELLNDDNKPPVAYISGLGGPISAVDLNFLGRCVSGLFLTMGMVFFVLGRRRLK